MMFRHFNKKSKKYPRLKFDMIKPNKPITAIQARQLYIDYMNKIGFLSKGQLLKYAKEFTENIKEVHGEFISNIYDFQDEIHGWKLEIIDCEYKLRLAETIAQQESINVKIDILEKDIVDKEESIETVKNELEEFKKDKRKFLVKYVNEQLGY